MITVVCNKCGNGYQIPDERAIPIHLLCAQCGEPNMTFDVDVEAMCVKCSQMTQVMAGVMFNVVHPKCHGVNWTLKAKKAVEKVVDGEPDFTAFLKTDSQTGEVADKNGKAIETKAEEGKKEEQEKPSAEVPVKVGGPPPKPPKSRLRMPFTSGGGKKKK